LSLYSKTFNYSLGGYSHWEHWSCTRNIDYWLEAIIDFIVNNMNIHCFTPIGRNLQLVTEKQPENFGYWNSQTRLTINSWYSSRVVAIKSLNVVVAKIMKVRPQDLSCMAYYTHMNVLCYYISVSTIRRKILVDALGTLRTTGILCLKVLNAVKDWVAPFTRFKSRGLSLK
jgi:hypothetical protein